MSTPSIWARLNTDATACPGCKAMDKRATPPSWALDKIADAKLEGSWRNRRVTCPVCFCRVNNHGICGCNADV